MEGVASDFAKVMLYLAGLFCSITQQKISYNQVAYSPADNTVVFQRKVKNRKSKNWPLAVSEQVSLMNLSKFSWQCMHCGLKTLLRYLS